MRVDGQPGIYISNLNKSIYNTKQDDHSLYDHLETGLDVGDFIQSINDPCIEFRDDTIVMVYMSGHVSMSKKKNMIIELIESIQKGPCNFKLIDEEDIKQHLVMELEK